MNKQNPDRGIETSMSTAESTVALSMNKQNPDRGIETATNEVVYAVISEYEQTESRPRD